MIKFYIEGNIPAQDFFWRQYEQFRPMGIPDDEPCLSVTTTFRNGVVEENFIIDDFQTQEAVDTSSSGGSVSFTVLMNLDRIGLA